MFTDSELVDQMMTFLAAGHGTTSHALQWAIYAPCKHPEIQDRLRKEVRSQLLSVADGRSVPSASHLDSLLYLRAVCNETLRLYPPVPSTIREALCDTTVGGYHIPKGTVFTISPAVTNVDVELWGPDAGDFNPERWMQDGRANSGGVSDAFGFLTFLQGPRSCIGATFARAELTCLLAVLVGRFRMELEDPNREEELTQRGVGAAPAGGLRARFDVIEGW
jgi:cytochrome P450